MGSVSKLQILNASSDVLRVTWVGVAGATAYRLAWGPSEGMAPRPHTALPGCECPLLSIPHPDRCPCSPGQVAPRDTRCSQEAQTLQKYGASEAESATRCE